MVGGYGGCDMGGWIWWPVALVVKERHRGERDKERERKNKK